MSLLLIQISNLVLQSGAAPMIDEGLASSNIGFVVLGIILGPVLVLTAVGIIEFPKRSKLPELFLGSFVMIVGSMVLSLALLGFLLKFIIPQ